MKNPRHAVFSTSLWNVGQKVYFYFMDGDQSLKAKAVAETIPIWLQQANICLVQTENPEEADIKISFQSLKGCWSAVGTEAHTPAYRDGATLNLGWIENAFPPSKADQATILHEFGHALGVEHEHQSPARGERFNFIEKNVYSFYGRLLVDDNEDLVKTQVIDQCNSASVFNHSHLDVISIMMYFMPAFVNEENLEVPPNFELSITDKAFITLTYPRTDKAAKAKGGLTVLEALKLAGVPPEVADKIMKPLKDLTDANPDAGTDADKDVTETNTALGKVRKGFRDYNDSVMKRAIANLKPRGGDERSGARDDTGKVINHPVQGSLGIVNEVFPQPGIPTVKPIPGSAQNDVQDPTATDPAFEGAIYIGNGSFSGDPVNAEAAGNCTESPRDVKSTYETST